jgi:AcrR family transcriptional regulator
VSRAEPTADASEAAGERKGQRTRRRILDAARGVFASVGYERATIRGIAAAAGVDKSSVIQYFGTKQALFREAVHWDIPIAELTSDDPVETTENLVRGMLAAWAADPNSPMAVLVRASMTSEDAAELLRTHITAQSVDAMAATIDAPDARLRAALAGAMLMGIVSQRYILKMPDLKDADVEDILRLVTPLVRTLLHPDGDE